MNNVQAIYEGEFRNNMQGYGYGRKIFDKKHKYELYEGLWDNGVPNGKGKLFLKDGSIHIGNFKNGLENYEIIKN